MVLQYTQQMFVEELQLTDASGFRKGLRHASSKRRELELK